ncbi:Exostosin-like [Macleaya cordata]|uniref:Exostosin-like n=1 Tax=Macleaya cordata TaxID=56857 RepID=A0A200QSE2_MACCD|nr:Exostosin-like [Macleaya cordata]
MSEKSMQPSRLLFCLITICMFFLILSSVLLLQSSSTSFIPGSVFRIILVNNNTSEYFQPKTNSYSKKPFSLSNLPSPIDTKKPKLRSDSSLGVGSGKVFNPNQTLLKVFMYDLPPEFHFGLLGWKGEGDQIWPDVSTRDKIPAYPGGLNLQHSIEYWLTLDLLASNTPGVVRPCSAVRVRNSSLADVIFVPFFSSLSYNRHSKLHGKRERGSVNRMLQDKLVEFLMSRDEWKKGGGKDHLIVAHHPNSMLGVRRKLGSAMFVLADFGRYPAEIANLNKDIIAPYKHVVRRIGVDDSAPFEGRSILAYFQGAIYRKDGGVIRQELYYLLKDEKDVHFTFGTVRGNGINRAGQGMADSKFCLNIAGDTPSSNRLFDAIVSHCVPVIISDEIELPFEDVLDYSEFCIFVQASDAIKKGYLLNLLRGIKPEKWTKMWKKLKEVAPLFEYQYPSLPGDAVEMIWQAVSRKRHSARFRLHKANRFRRYQLMGKMK